MALSRTPLFRNHPFGNQRGSGVVWLLLVSTIAFFSSAQAQDGQSGKPQEEKKKDAPQKAGGSIEDLAPIKKPGAKAEPTEAASKDGYWLIDAKAAFEKAKKENKSVIMNFTGSDWCSWCIKLEGEVFSKKEFSKEATKHFVFVKLDFPSDKSGQTDAEKKQNEELKSKFGVAGFPSIYICDTQGRPFAKTGYKAGGPKKYWAHLQTFRDKLTERNELFALAAKETGDKKAELLDRALSLMDQDIATIHYEDVIEKIVELDKDNKIGLRAKYYAAQDAEERKRILEKVYVIANNLDPKRAIVEIDKALKEVTLPANSLIDALQQKLYLLKMTDQTEAADKLLEQMVSVDGLTDDRRERLLVQKAFNYVETQRAKGALSYLDEMIQTYPRSYVLHETKGTILEGLGDPEAALKAYDDAIEVAGGSESMAELIVAKAYALVSLEKLDHAIKVFESFIESDLHPDYIKADLLVQKSVLLRETGRAEAAKLAEKQALEMAESDEQRQELTELIEQLQEID